jgi:hypothetical protein
MARRTVVVRDRGSIMSGGILVNAITFIFWLFLMVVVFYVLAGPVDTIFDSFIENPVVIQQVTMTPYYKIAVRMAFAIGISTPVVWFFARMFSREPAYFKQRRY